MGRWGHFSIGVKMSFNQEQYVYYLKKEQEATSTSTKALYKKLKKLYRDRVVIVELLDNIYHSKGNAALEEANKLLGKQIGKNEEKLSILMNLDVDLPEF